MTGYTERTISLKNVMECLIKVQKPFLNQYAEKILLDGWIKFTKNTYGV